MRGGTMGGTRVPEGGEERERERETGNGKQQ